MTGRVRWAALGHETPEVMNRGGASTREVSDAVRAIIADVRKTGDEALFEMGRRFDGVDLIRLEVPASALRAALRDLDTDVRAALEEAAGAIEAFHRAQIPSPMEIETYSGVRLGRMFEPIPRVGVYAPGGRAAYASSVLMGVIPARVAGVGRVVVCSPPASDGNPPPMVLAAAELAGADSVYSIGGAGAIAALAFGTQSVPRVDKIVGPGNAYVTEAKLQLTGVVAIDGPAGPSEILVIADETADPRLVAGELLAQAEHDPEAACVLVSNSDRVLHAVRAAVDEMVVGLPDSATVRAAFAARGALLKVEGLEQAFQLSERFGPEHLMIATRNPREWLDRVRCAGTIFLGQSSSVVFGDYITGANHVLPTGGLSRAYGGLSTGDFQRGFTYQEVTPSAAAKLSEATAILADVEGLPAHADAARLRRQIPPVVNGESNSGQRVSPGRASLRDVKLYDPMRAPARIDLSANTNLYPEDPGIRSAIAGASPRRIAQYPDVYTSELMRAIADHHGVAPENVVTGCGSDDLIDSAMRAFADPGSTVVYPDPTFGMVRIFTGMNAAIARPIPLRHDLTLDVEGMLNMRAQIQYVCSPNNPTGGGFSPESLLSLSRRCAAVTLLDEAYADFADQDLIAEAAGSDRLVVLRTFSKAFGLAGMRVGYAVGPADLIREIQKSRGPYKVGGIAEAAALYALGRGFERVRSTVEGTKENRDRLSHALGERGFDPLPSSANFLLVPVEGASARDWAALLRTAGVEVRPFGGLPLIGEAIRITIGPWALMAGLLTALDEIAREIPTPERNA